MAETAKDDVKRRNLSASTFQDFVEELTTLGDQKDRVVGKIRNRRKAAKEAGINLGEMDAVLKLKTMDTDEIKQNEADRLLYAKWLKVDLGFQASLDLPEPDEEHVERVTKHDTYRQGYEAGKRGDLRTSNRYGDKPGSPAYASWDQGWGDGDDDVFKNAPKPKPRVANKGVGAEMGPTDEQKAATDAPADATNPAGDATVADPAAADAAPEGTTIQ